MLGGLPAPKVRELNRLAEQLERDGELQMASYQSLKAGSQLVRYWHGRVYTVTVLDQGFEFEEQHYSSLTQIARQITGAAWSGPRFFGLKNRGDR